MSDDEWDEYDDEDVLWIEEPDPTAADDLAEAATHDVLYIDDPSLDIEDVYSDWDEMSDDYYDDDPTVERRRRVLNAMKNSENATEPHEGSQQQGRRQQKTLVHRLTRRGVAEDSPSSTTDYASFQAVVWKTSDDEKDTVSVYEPGDGGKVALLKNWREVFRNSHPVIDRLRMRKTSHIKSDMDRSRPQSVDGFSQRRAQKEDSSDCTSGISSLENLRETDAGSDNSMSSTPPDLASPVPLENSKEIEPIAIVPEVTGDKYLLDDSEMDDLTTTVAQADSTSQVEHSLSPIKKGRKRKASESVEEQPDKSMDVSKRLRSHSDVLNKAGKETAAAPASSVPTRRSTKQKANQK